jgi:hypothetical protein
MADLELVIFTHLSCRRLVIDFGDIEELISAARKIWSISNDFPGHLPGMFLLNIAKCLQSSRLKWMCARGTNETIQSRSEEMQPIKPEMVSVVKGKETSVDE